jgi:ribosomal protein S18 acetylase RimI-like enzyme
MTVVVRAAEPEDSEFLSWCLLAAGQGHLRAGFWDVAMPDPERRAMLAEWLVLSDVRSTCHFGNFLIGEVDGAAAAALAVYDAGDPDMASLAPAIMDAFDGCGWDTAEMDAIARRLAPYRTCAPAAKAGTWVVEWVATAPAHRRRGLVQTLLDKALDAGRARGLARAQVSIMSGNTAAQAAYERAGFRLHDERRDPDFEATFGAPGMVTFTRGLGRAAELDDNWRMVPTGARMASRPPATGP